MTRESTTRRTFLKTSAAAAGFAMLPGPVFGWSGSSPNDKLRIACIGAGGRGGSAVDAAVNNETLVAFADVDDDMAAKAKQKAPKAKVFRDYRLMFEQMGDQIDAVTISTPDHMHFAPAYAALQMGKHVFCEKPLTHSIWEARQLRTAARKAGVATQMGNQGHANEGTRRVVEIVRSGVLGVVREVHHWTNRPIWAQGMGRPDHSECVPVVPKNLDWDLWLGVAADRPYDPAYCPFNWRGWWDFGTGALGDMGCHIMDSAYWALDLGAPKTVEAVATARNAESAPKASMVRYRYGKKGGRPGLDVVWHDGGLRPVVPISLGPKWKWKANGTLIVGDNASLLCDTYSDNVQIVPEAKEKELESSLPAPTLPRVEGGHYAEWFRACRGGTPAGSNFEYAAPFTEAVLLGNLAVRSGRPIEWDSKNLRATNFEPANRFVRRAYRKGFGV